MRTSPAIMSGDTESAENNSATCFASSFSSTLRDAPISGSAAASRTAFDVKIAEALSRLFLAKPLLASM
jgi:hypothetical protein